MSVRLDVAQGDLLDLDVDVVVVKYAQSFHASDGAVGDRLRTVGFAPASFDLPPGKTAWVDARGALAAKAVLFVGTVPLSSFGYLDVRLLAGKALAALAAHAGPVRTVGITVHGANCGLDEDEAGLALAGGLIDAIQRGAAPDGLERIVVIEKRAARAKRLDATFRQRLVDIGHVRASGGAFDVQRPATTPPSPSLPTHGTSSLDKPHAFVAMPFAPEFEDVFHYGIQVPLRDAGLLCERVDQAVFSGLIIDRILSRIASAKVVVAELTGANPNVYLEVGYAWALKVPTVLLVRDVAELRFDVKGHRCLVYGTIRQLEQALRQELGALGLR